MLSHITYRIIKKQSQHYNYFKHYYTTIYPNINKTYRALFINVGHHDIDLDGHISPEKIVKIFAPIFQKQFTIVTVEIYGMSSTTEYFTHFVEYTLSINAQISYRLVYYLNVNDPTLFKYYITVHDNYEDCEAPTIFTSNFVFEEGQKVDFAYVTYNCEELGFRAAEKKDYVIPSICKFCYYKTNLHILPCTIHPTLKHSQLRECKDFKSIKRLE
jgi:hypothetical protein